jgi:hypothetical protein
VCVYVSVCACESVVCLCFRACALGHLPGLILSVFLRDFLEKEAEREREKHDHQFLKNLKIIVLNFCAFG